MSIAAIRRMRGREYYRWPAAAARAGRQVTTYFAIPNRSGIRPVALGRKNHLFAGSDGGGARWATVSSLIATAKLNDVEPFA